MIIGITQLGAHGAVHNLVRSCTEGNCVVKAARKYEIWLGLLRKKKHWKTVSDIGHQQWIFLRRGKGLMAILTFYLRHHRQKPVILHPICHHYSKPPSHFRSQFLSSQSPPRAYRAPVAKQRPSSPP